MKFSLKRCKELSDRIPFARIIFLVSMSVLYFVPPVRRFLTSKLSSGRSDQKIDQSYDMSLYHNYKKLIQQHHPAPYTSMLDIGSGDGVLHAIQFILKDGVNRFYLADEFMFPDIIWSRVNEYVQAPQDMERVKDALRLVKTSEGRLVGIPDNELDVVISTSLFEHVLRSEVPKIITDLYAKLAKGGIAMFSIDLRDHYDFTHPFAFYRYPEWLWNIMTRDRARYTNRLRTSDFMRIFTDCGFSVLNTVEEKSSVPMPKNMAAKFRTYSKESLQTIQLTVVLQKES